MDALARYIRATAAELRQVTWPTQQQAMLYTALVIGITVVVALYVGVFDYLFAEVIAMVSGSI
ncbi:preprotein translocase subunit SecE [Candidatus Kaiserbacteria bacterium]|nr:preprotein translocase subunit SecE [Candidatus Kaiserbacteria bacterium]